MRPPRPLVRMNAMQGQMPLGHKAMSESAVDKSMTDLVGLLANSQPVGQLDPDTAKILSQVLGKHARS